MDFNSARYVIANVRRLDSVHTQFDVYEYSKDTTGGKYTFLRRYKSDTPLTTDTACRSHANDPTNPYTTVYKDA